MIELDDQNRVSSSQFAELLGYEKKEINKKIRNMFSEEIASGKIPCTLYRKGRVDDYFLPEIESIIFASKWNVDFFRSIIKFWKEDSKH